MGLIRTINDYFDRKSHIKEYEINRQSYDDRYKEILRYVNHKYSDQTHVDTTPVIRLTFDYDQIFQAAYLNRQAVRSGLMWRDYAQTFSIILGKLSSTMLQKSRVVFYSHFVGYAQPVNKPREYHPVESLFDDFGYHEGRTSGKLFFRKGQHEPKNRNDKSYYVDKKIKMPISLDDLAQIFHSMIQDRYLKIAGAVAASKDRLPTRDRFDDIASIANTEDRIKCVCLDLNGFQTFVYI